MSYGVRTCDGLGFDPNLSAIAQNCLPASTNSFDLGSSSLIWNNLWATNVNAVNINAINVNYLDVKDELINLGVGNGVVGDVLNGGFTVEYKNGSSAQGGLVRSATNKSWYLFKDSLAPVTTSTNLATLTLADLQVGNLIASSTSIVGLTPNTILSSNSSGTIVSQILNGTANQITISGTPGSGTLTLSLPQSIATSSSVTFGDLTDSGLTANRWVCSDLNKKLVSQILLGTTNQIILTGNAGSGTTTLSLPQDIATTSSPTFSTVNATTSALISSGGAKAFIGDIGYGMASFSNNATATLTGYCLLQASSGETFLNATTATAVHLRINNVDKITVTSSASTIFNTLNMNALSASLPLQLDASKNVISALISLSSGITGTLPVANGGSNSSTALTNGKIMVSSGGAIIEGTSSTDPIFSTLTTSGDIKSTAGNVVLTNVNELDIGGTRYLESLIYVGSAVPLYGITNNFGSIQVGGLGGLAFLTSGSPSATFNCPVEIGGAGNNRSLFLKNDNTPLVLGVTNTTTIKATVPSANRIYTIPDTGANSTFIMSDLAQTINGAKTFSSALNITDSTDTTSATTGSLVTAGGAGIGKNLFVGGSTITLAGGAVQTITMPTPSCRLLFNNISQIFYNSNLLTIDTGASNGRIQFQNGTVPGFYVLQAGNGTVGTQYFLGSRYNTLDNGTTGAMSLASTLAVTGNTTTNGLIAGQVFSPQITGETGIQNSALAVNQLNYALIQNNVGATFLGAPTGQSINFRINNTGVAQITSTAITASQPIVATSRGIQLGNYIEMENTTPINFVNGSNVLTWSTLVTNSNITYSGGVFTCPLAGIYLVTFSTGYNGTSFTGDASIFSINSNSTSKNRGLQSVANRYTNSTAIHRLTGANQTITCMLFNSGSAFAQTISSTSVVSIQMISAL